MYRRAWRTSLTSPLRLVAARGLRYKVSEPLISIKDAKVYRTYPSSQDQSPSEPLIYDRLNFELLDGEHGSSAQFWAIVSPSSISRTTLLQVLAGRFVVLPPNARRYPLLSELNTSPHHAIKYVGFDADRGTSVSGDSVRGAYLSARYESRREETDFSLHDYLLGNTAINALERERCSHDHALLEEIVAKLNLQDLREMPVANLSNGQTRRARIAKALMSQPEVLLLDGPFMGLDPNTVVRLSGILQRIATRGKPRLVISLRPEDEIPAWVSHLIALDEQNRIVASGSKDQILSDRSSELQPIINHASQDSVSKDRVSRDGFTKESPAIARGEAVVQMNGAVVSYGAKVVLGGWKQSDKTSSGLWWSLHRGDRCGIFGANGSGKTTMLSLITSDHPQTYSLPVKLFGKSRLPKPGEIGITLFDLQRRMGHSSPEVHAYFPRRLSLRRALESAWADAPLAKPVLNAFASAKVDQFLKWFAPELRPAHLHTNVDDLSWAKEMPFGEMSFSNQRLVLFLRAIIASPDLVILDEAFSGMDEVVRDKAQLFLSYGEGIAKVKDGVAVQPDSVSDHAFKGLSSNQALLVISHAREDVPGCIRQWICLQEPGEGAVPRVGTLSGPLELNPDGWNEIWGKKISS